MGCLSVKRPHPSTSAASEKGSNVITHREKREEKGIQESYPSPPERERQKERF